MKSFKHLLSLSLLILLSVSLLQAQTGSQKVDLKDNWQFRQAGQGIWQKATVPGCVHTDLLAAGKIEDPFWRDNEKKLQWIGKSDWEYSTSFELNKESLRKNIDLVFEGLDTYADVYLNGKKILTAENMFCTWRLDISNYLLPGENELLIRFTSPVNRILPTMKNIPYQLPASNDQGEKTSPFTRKAPYQFGWDWGPRFVTCGIWRPVYLEIWDEARINDIHVVTKSLTLTEEKKAELAVNVEIFAAEAGEYQIDYILQSSEEYTYEFEGDFRNRIFLKKGINSLERVMMVPNPALWWPRRQGEQNLYRLTVELRRKEEMIAAKPVVFGIRTVELEQKRDEKGESFTVVINGRPVFAKGANWIPADIFPSRLTPEKYAELLESCAEANFNMLRVWGGGIYEDDEFYLLCDELGIMVWQDFMFACSMYPGDNNFLENVRAEAIDNIKRLRNHPALVLWCGNNENETAWNNWGWKKELPEKVWDDYLKLFHNVLPQAVALYDPGKPYWPSSPSSNLTAEANAENIGDQHYWGVWHGEEKFEEYKKHTPRFSSEYGFQSFPMIKTVNSYTLPEDHDIESPVMKAHQKHPRGNELIRKYMDWYYPQARDFESFLYLSQVLQAEGIKVAAEHLIGNMPWCMGSLYWQTNDCWPVASWSGIDYFGRWKALQYYARSFYADLLLIVDINKENRLEIFVVKTGGFGITEEFEGEILLLDTTGEVIARSAFEYKETKGYGRGPVTAPGLEDFPILSEKGEKGKYFYYLNLKDNRGNIVAEQYYFPSAMKDLKMIKPEIKYHILESLQKTEEPDLYEVQSTAMVVDWHPSINRYPREGREEFLLEMVISTDKPTFNIYLEFPGVEGHFSDNFFHLMPGQERIVVFKARSREELQKAASSKPKVISLIDAFK